MGLKRKHLAAIGFVMFAVLAQLVGAVAQTATDPRVADLVKAGKIRIGVFPSFQYSTATGQPQGLAIGFHVRFPSALVLARS
jgi:ABC-type amino acid transport substrate-binding protein